MSEPDEAAANEAFAGARRLPQDLEAEQSVLGGLLLAPEKFAEIEGRLDRDDFFNPGYGLIFQAMLNLHNHEKPIDIVLLRDEMKREGTLEKVGGAVALAALADVVPTGVNVEYYAQLVRGKALQRRLAHAATEILERATDPAGGEAHELIDAAEAAIFQVAERNVSNEPQAMRQVMNETFARMEKMAGSQIAPDSVMTGYYELDQMLTGFHGGELIIVAGRPSMGKSTFALNIARRVAVDHQQGVLIFSLEMTAVNIAGNILAAEAHMEAQKMRQAKLSNAEFEKLGVSAGKLSEARLYIDDASVLSIAEMRGKARRMKQRHDISLVVVDYLQLMQASSRSAQRSREQEVAEISRGLKALAKELNIPVIALSQLSRKTTDRSDSRPVMSDLRESGAIEQDADVILLLHRPDYYNKDDHPGEAEVIIAKQRNGPTGTINLTFINHQLRFEPLSRTSDLSDGGE